jgi:hypothetical protein
MATWSATCSAKKAAHFSAARGFARNNLWLGVPATVLSAAAGTTVFAATQQASASKPLLVLAAAVSMLTAVLTALQTFLKPDAKQQEHKDAYTRYAGLQTRIASVLAREPSELDIAEARSELDAITREAPIVGDMTK